MIILHSKFLQTCTEYNLYLVCTAYVYMLYNIRWVVKCRQVHELKMGKYQLDSFRAFEYVSDVHACYEVLNCGYRRRVSPWSS